MKLGKVPIWLIYIVLIVALYLGSLLIPSIPNAAIKSTLADAPKATLDVILAIIQLIVALNTGMLAAAGAITIKRNDWSRHWSRVDDLLILTVFISSAVSYYGVYLHTSPFLKPSSTESLILSRHAFTGPYRCNIMECWLASSCWVSCSSGCLRAKTRFQGGVRDRSAFECLALVQMARPALVEPYLKEQLFSICGQKN